MSSQGDPYGQTYGPYRSYKIQNNVLGKYEDVLRDLKREEMNQPDFDDGDTSLVEFQRLRQEASTYTDNAKSYSSHAQSKIPVDLDGWPYVNDAMGGVHDAIDDHIDDLRQLQSNLADMLSGIDVGDSTSISLDEAYVRGLHIETGLGRMIVVNRDDEDMYSVVGPGIVHEDVSRSEAVGALQQEIDDHIADIETLHNEVGMSAVHDYLDSIDFDVIKVVLNFEQHASRSGLWKRDDRLLEVDMPADVQSVESFDTIMNMIEQRARHECQHVAQDLLKELKDLEEIAGVPSDHIRNPDWTPHGLEKDRSPYMSPQRKDHALRDIEFQTRLTDEIDHLDSMFESLPDQYHRDLFDMWTARDRDAIDVDTQVELQDRIDPPFDIKVRPFFRQLKSKESEKWEDAVSKAWAELQDRGWNLSS